MAAWRGHGPFQFSRSQAAWRGLGRFPVFATCPVVTVAHRQTIADRGEKKDGHCEVHTSRRTSFTASSPRSHRRFAPGPYNCRREAWSMERYLPPFGQDANGQANRSPATTRIWRLERVERKDNT